MRIEQRLEQLSQFIETAPLLTRRQLGQAVAVGLLGAACAKPDQAQVQQAPDSAIAVIARATAEAESSSSSRPREIPEVEFVPYELKDRPYQTVYPKTWNASSFPETDLENGLDNFSAPNFPSPESLKTTIRVFYAPVAPEVSLDQLAQEVKAGYIENNKEYGGTDFNPQQKPFNAAGYPAILTSSRYVPHPLLGEYEGRSVTFIAGGKSWHFALRTSELDKTMPILEEMVKNFKLTQTAESPPVQRAQEPQRAPEALPGKLYVSPKLHYSISYPPNWWPAGFSIIGDEFYTGKDSSGLALGALRVNVEAPVATIENHIQGRISSLPRSVQNVTQERSNPIFIDGMQPHVLRYIFPRGESLDIPFTGLATSNRSISVIEAFLLRNAQVWRIQIAHDATIGTQVNEEINKMFKTFKFLR